MKLKFDLHVHTVNSRDAFTKLDDLRSLCRLNNLDGVAITDHNAVCEKVPDGLIAIRGVEVSSANGHIIGLGLSDRVQRGLSADETITAIHKLGGLAVIPHPYDPLRSSVKPEILTVRPDAIEVVNASTIFSSISWRKAREFAVQKGLPAVAGSDSHIPQTLGTAYTIVDDDSSDAASVLEAIKAGNVSAAGRTIRLAHRVRKLALQAFRKPSGIV